MLCARFFYTEVKKKVNKMFKRDTLTVRPDIFSMSKVSSYKGNARLHKLTTHIFKHVCDIDRGVASTALASGIQYEALRLLTLPALVTHGPNTTLHFRLQELLLWLKWYRPNLYYQTNTLLSSHGSIARPYFTHMSNSPSQFHFSLRPRAL